MPTCPTSEGPPVITFVCDACTGQRRFPTRVFPANRALSITSPRNPEKVVENNTLCCALKVTAKSARQPNPTRLVAATGRAMSFKMGGFHVVPCSVS
jgi:hypothetical protein